MSETPKFAKPFVGINLPHAKVHNSMVRKRNGNIVPMNYDEITLRISGLCVGLFGMVDPVKVAQLVIRDIPDGVVETQMLDVLAYERAASLVLENPAYDVLAARIAVSNH
ncbi:MAG: ATP cone domain-containing protein, partial [Culicoidibacterales bacterium]